ncbi:cohesin domain-containing protein [Balneolaceae bacterium ANBcel3]|nr:cohesin domain-containing protein [Balneolaceae bacterium ANBcel3]
MYKLKNKIVSALTALMALLLVGSASLSAQDVELDFGHDISGRPGDVVEIPVMVSDLSDFDVPSFQINIDYDGDLLQDISVQGGALIESAPTYNVTDDQILISYAQVDSIKGAGELLIIEATLGETGVNPDGFVVTLIDLGDGTLDVAPATPFSVTVMSADYAVDLPVINGNIGDVVQASISTRDSLGELDIAAYEIAFTYDPEVITISDITAEGTASEGWVVSSNIDESAGTVSIAGAGAEALLELEDILFFTISLDEETVRSPLLFTNISFTDGSGSPVAIAGLNGHVTATIALDLISIADARALDDDEMVKVEGIVTSPDHGFGVADYFIQDETGGINITDFNDGGVANGPYVQPGDKIVITGELSTFRNQRNLEVIAYEIVESGLALPEAITVTAADLSDDSPYQGMRVLLENMFIIDEDIDNWPVDGITSGSGVDIHITNEAGEDTIVVRLARNNTAWENGAPLPPSTFHLTGVMGQFWETTQIFPFEEADFADTVEIPEPPMPPFDFGDILNVNGQFEYAEVGPADGVPYWSLNPGQGSMEIVELDEGALEGQKALRIDFGEWNGTQNDWEVEAINEPFNVQEGDIIRVSLWIKSDADDALLNMMLGLPGSGDWARYGWNRYLPDVAATGGGGTMISPTDEWQEFYYEHAVSATDEEHGMRFGLALNFEQNHESVLHVANVQVEKVLPGPPEPPHAVQDILNLNGDFFFTELGNVVDVDPYLWAFNNNAGNSTLEIVDDARRGDKSLRIDFGEWDGSAANDWHVEAVNEPFYPEAGDILEASVWMKAENGPAIANMFLGLPASGDWARPSETMLDLHEDWTRYVAYYEATEADEEHSMRIGFALNYEENENSVIYINWLRVVKVESMPSSVEQPETVQEFALGQNYPNPFNPTTTIRYELPTASHVTIDVYNVLGQRVANLVNRDMSAGVHTVNFDGSSLSSGIYIYRMQAGDFVKTNKMMLVK